MLREQGSSVIVLAHKNTGFVCLLFHSVRVLLVSQPPFVGTPYAVQAKRIAALEYALEAQGGGVASLARRAATAQRYFEGPDV
jgi:hypothetical protein